MVDRNGCLGVQGDAVKAASCTANQDIWCWSSTSSMISSSTLISEKAHALSGFGLPHLASGGTSGLSWKGGVGAKQLSHHPYLMSFYILMFHAYRLLYQLSTTGTVPRPPAFKGL